MSSYLIDYHLRISKWNVRLNTQFQFARKRLDRCVDSLHQFLRNSKSPHQLIAVIFLSLVILLQINDISLFALIIQPFNDAIINV
jgi:hypothetical protein